MRPRPFTLAAAVSAVLCAAVVGGWAMDAADVRCVNSGGRFYFMHVGRDPSATARVTVGIEDMAGHGQGPPAVVVRHRVEWPSGDAGESVSRPLDGRPRWEAAGAAAWAGAAMPPPRIKGTPGHPPVGYWAVAIPFWWGSAPAAILLIAAAVRAARRRASQGHGLCPSCGYDLRASPGRCPERGTQTKDAAG